MATFADLALDRGMPASVDAERTILGAILLDNVAYVDTGGKLRPDDFSLDSHRKVYARMVEMLEAGRAVDTVTLAEALEQAKELDGVGGKPYLWSLTESLPRRLSIESYVRIVRGKAMLRHFMRVAQEGIERAADQSEEPLDLLNDIEQKLMELTERGVNEGLSTVEEVVRGSFGTIDALYRHGREVTGLATHYTEFDRMTSGLQKQELIIIAARPSMGKTAWAINIAQKAAIQGDGVVAIFSLEMSKESLLRRLLAAQSQVGLQEIQKGFLSREAIDKLRRGLEQLVTAKIFLDDTPGISLAEMRAKARRLKQQQGQLDLVVIDYLQLMSSTPGSGRRYENRTQEVSAISRGLKVLAKELDVPVVALSQLSRAPEARGGKDKRPLLSDLRESGSIEQDADVVAFIHREEYYDRDNPELKGKADIIIAKQRNGPTGTVHLMYADKFTLFANMETTPYEDVQ
jgi:replicative DNA helicase